MVKNAGSLCLSHEFRSKANQSACRDNKLESSVALELQHGFHLTAPLAKILDDRSNEFVGYIDNHMFHWFTQDVIDSFDNDFRAGHLKLVSFSSHGLDQNGEMEFSSSTDLENVGGFSQLDAQAHVRSQFAREALPQITRSHESAFLTPQRGMGDHE